MSEEIKNEEIVTEPGKDDFVTKKAYGEVSNSMHKYKSELKDTKALLNQLQEEREAAKNEALAENGRWEELYKSSQYKNEELSAKANEDKNKFIDYHKKNSVLGKIGGFKRDEYNNFINVESINLNDDGSIDDASLNAEIDRIKQTYPELLNVGTAQKLPNNAAQSNTVGELSPSEMTPAQKNDYFKQMLLNKK